MKMKWIRFGGGGGGGCANSWQILVWLLSKFLQERLLEILMGTNSSVFGIIQKQTGILWNGVFFFTKEICNITFSQRYELQKLHVTKLPRKLGHPLFFLRLPPNAFPDIGSVSRIEKKKPKKNHKKSQNSRPCYPRTTLKVNIHIFGLKKCTRYCEKCSCFCSCFSLCCYYAHFSD